MINRFIIIVFLLIQVSFIHAQNKEYVACEVSYEKLKSALYDATPHHCLSAFVNLDFSLPNFLLQKFILDNLDVCHHTENCKWLSNMHWQEEYRPCVLVGDDLQYIQVHYYLKSLDSSGKNKCEIIEKCEIVGTPALILRLYIAYWGDYVTIVEQKNNEIAHTDFMGDRIALYVLSDELYKIVVTDNGKSFNYKLNFGKT